MALCNPMDYTIHGILQARILELVAIPFSRGSSQPRDWTRISLIAGRFFTSWATRETQDWSGQPILSPGYLPYPGMEPGSPALRVDSLPAELPGKPIQWIRVSLTIKFICIQYLFHSIHFYQMLLPTPPPTSKNGCQSIQGGFLDGEESAPFPV